MKDYNKFRFWCQKVLPLVYDNSLSYYEVLCKCVDYINHILEHLKTYNDEFEEELNNLNEELNNLNGEINTIKQWINNFDTSYAEKIIKEYISTMIFIEISDNGYVIYNIPEEWEDITFNTTGLDINLELQPNYGHLVLSY